MTRHIHQIKWKLTLVILATTAVVLLLGALVIGAYDAVTSRANLRSQVETMAVITAENSAAALAFGVARDAQETLDALRARPEIDLACLYLNDGSPFVFFATNGMTFDAMPPVDQLKGPRFLKDRLVLKHPVLLRGEAVGAIVICANQKEQANRSRTFFAIALGLLAGLFGLALLLATRLQRLISDPIGRLSQAANHITTYKDYSVRVPDPPADEIGSLVVAFNQMLSEIDRQNNDLTESKNRLKLALAAAKMGVWEWSLQTDAVSWSEEVHFVFGPPAPDTTLDSFLQIIHREDVEAVASELRHSVEKRISFTVEYRVAAPDGTVRWVAHHGHVRCNAAGAPTTLAGIVQDISARRSAEAEQQKLIGKLLHAEEDERRRIARELHDTTTQHLAALKMSLAPIWTEPRAKLEPKLVAESRQLLDQALQEIRTLAYVLHPPVLEEFGLTGALKDFASGITRRSGVQVRVDTAEYEGRLPRTVELTLFRVVQESVANALRHSGTNEISIRLARDSQEVRVEIQDFGRGFASDPKASRNSGVGIAAMHERLALIGGMLHVESDSEGVTVLASAPVAPESPNSNHSVQDSPDHQP